MYIYIYILYIYILYIYYIYVYGVFSGGGHNWRSPPKPLNLVQLTDQLLFSPHLAKVQGHAIYLINDSEIFLSLTALVVHFTLFISPTPIVLSKNTCSRLVILYTLQLATTSSTSPLNLALQPVTPSHQSNPKLVNP